MLFNTPVKVHLYLKVYSFHVFLSFYSSLSGAWRVGDLHMQFLHEELGSGGVGSCGKPLSSLRTGSCPLANRK